MFYEIDVLGKTLLLSETYYLHLGYRGNETDLISWEQNGVS